MTDKVKEEFRVWAESQGLPHTNTGPLGDAYALGAWHGWQASRQAIEVVEEKALATTPAANDWIDWAGGDCPVADGPIYEIMLRDRSQADTRTPEDWRWSAGGGSGSSDIIKYRIKGDL